MTTLSTLAAIAACVLAGGTALAQPADPTFVKGDAKDLKDVKDVTWAATGEAGLISTTGNSKSTTITIGGEASRRDKDNKLDVVVAGAFSRATTRIATDTNGDGMIEEDELSSQSQTAAENANGKVRYDRFLTDLNSLYVAALAATDKPAGKKFLGGGQVGYSRSIYKDDMQDLLGEVGYDLSYLKLETDASTTIHSARVFAGYKLKIKKDTELDASVEALFNLNSISIAPRTAGAFGDTRLDGMLGVTTSLSDKLSLNVSFTAKYDQFPAPLAEIGMTPFAPGFVPIADTIDTITKISLIAKFL